MTNILPEIQANQQVSLKALALACQGFPVVPFKLVTINGVAKKLPTAPHGFKSASHEPQEAERLFIEYPGNLIGVPTGGASGFDVLDIDLQHGGAAWLDANREKLPATRIHKTYSGGWHYLFQHHAGLKNSVSQIAPGVDVRTNGGGIIWWPASGYPVLNDAPPALWPDWLLTLALPPPSPKFDSTYASYPKGEGYAAAALARAAESIAATPEGGRNDLLNREAFALLRFAETGELAPLEIAEILAQAALAAGLEQREITSTLISAFRARGL